MYPHLSVLKIGEFQGGLFTRRLEDAEHFHRHPPGQFSKDAPCPLAPNVFSECLRSAITLDLSEYDAPTVERDENSLRASLDQFVEQQRLSVKNRNGDYRVLTAAVDVQTLVAEFRRRAIDELEHIWRRAVS